MAKGITSSEKIRVALCFLTKKQYSIVEPHSVGNSCLEIKLAYMLSFGREIDRHTNQSLIVESCHRNVLNLSGES